MASKTDIQCPACNTIFKVDIAKIPEKGCYANCKKCKERFLISRPPPPTGAPDAAPAKKAKSTPAAGSPKKEPPADSAPIAEPTDTIVDPIEEALSAENLEITAEFDFIDDPVDDEPLADIPPIAEAKPAAEEPVEKNPPVYEIPAPTAKPGKKKNYLLIASLASVALLVCIGAVLFLLQKYNFRITAKDSSLTSQNENTQTYYNAGSRQFLRIQSLPQSENENSSAQINPEVNIGDLFNQVNPAVATVLTYDSGNNIFMQGSGFFISQDGDFITNYHVLKGAYYVVIKFHNEIEYRARIRLGCKRAKRPDQTGSQHPGGHA